MTTKYERIKSMSDKEVIMIDSVDVRGCEFWNICEQCELSQLEDSSYNITCKNNVDCSYKQYKKEQERSAEAHKNCIHNLVLLKRKTKECENQRATIDYYIEKQTQLLDELQTEKQKVKELEEFKANLLRPVILPAASPEVINLTQKYKQALEEIRKLLEKPLIDCMSENGQRQDEFMMNLSGRVEQKILQLKQILQKCEVLKD